MFPSAPPFWQNGPAPGEFYNFPGTQTKSTNFHQHTQSPVTTSTSIIALKYNNGVIIAADLLASYGSLARYRNCPRLTEVNENIILGAGGDYADFQHVNEFIKQKVVTEECLDDGIAMKPKSLYCWLTRIMYERRTKMDPIWNNFVIAGIQDEEPFLGTVDKLGTAYQDKVICTGYGAHLVCSLIRDALDRNSKMKKAEARELIEKCMEVLYYRDARSFPKYEIGIIDIDDGVCIEGPLLVKQNWSVANMT